MASGGGGEPPDKLNIKYYKCHPKMKCATVVCVICEGAYHMSDFNQLNNTKILSDTLVICPDHVDEVNITSKTKNVALNEAARTIIAQIKNNQKQDLRRKLLQEIGEERRDEEHDTTLFEDHNELESLRIENALLKQLNTELQEKNDLLKKLLAVKENTNNNDNKISYAEVIKSEKSFKKRIPKLKVKKINLEERTTTKEIVLHYLNKEKSILTNKVEFNNQNDATIFCKDEKSVSIAEDLLKSKVTDSFIVEKEEIMKPKIKIVGLENYYKRDKEALEKDINNRNFNNCKTKCKVLHVYTNEKTQLQGIIAEVPSDLYKIIRESNNKVFVGHQRCKVYDLINVKPCFNCGRFGHSGSKCHNDKKCLKCAGKHDTKNCQSDTLKCLNCSYSNSKYKTNFETSHSTCDNDTCAIMKSKIRNYIDMTDYPMRPVIPKYTDNAGSYRQQKITSSASLTTSA